MIYKQCYYYQLDCHLATEVLIMRRMAKEAVRKAIAVVGGVVSEKLVRLYCFCWWRSLSIVNKTKLLLLVG